jgi:hypothetical protein
VRKAKALKPCAVKWCVCLTASTMCAVHAKRGETYRTEIPSSAYEVAEIGDCDYCAGDGVCDECHGDGDHACDCGDEHDCHSCGGTGECEKCDGTGYSKKGAVGLIEDDQAYLDWAFDVGVIPNTLETLIASRSW